MTAEGRERADAGPRGRDPVAAIETPHVPLSAAATLGFYCLACCLPAFAFAHIIENIISTPGLIFQLLIFCVLLAATVGGAFCFYVPLLYFSRLIARVVVAVALPAVVWLALMGGWATTNRGLLSGELLNNFRLFLVALAGGAVPAGTLVWLRAWRLYRGDPLDTRPTRLTDIFAIVTVCAVFFAILRGAWADANRMDSQAMVMCATLGAAAGIPSLFGIGILLRPRVGRRRRATWIALLLSIAVVFGGWTVPFVAAGGPPNRDPLVMYFLLSITTWLTIITCAVLSGLWFRILGFRLATARDGTGESPSIAVRRG